MRIFALQGVNSTGKTGTLKQVIDKLIALGYTIIDKSRIENDNNDIAITLKSPQGKTVCVYTQGDIVCYVRRALEYFNTHNCDIGFCAVRLKGNGAKELYNLNGKNDLNITFIHKAYIGQESISENVSQYKKLINDSQAEFLIKLI